MSRLTNTLSRFWPVAVLLGLLLLFFNKMAFSNLILARGDTFLYFYPYWEAAADALRHGRVPLWNDAIFMGAPLLANSQVGFFYPLNWPVWWLLPVPYAVSASILLHLALAGAGAYLAARRALGVGRMGGLVTAVAFALGGYLTAQVEHINQLQGLAWLPWFLAVLAPPLAEGWQPMLRRTLAVTALFALQLAAGHSQSTFITGVGVGLWLLVQMAQQWRREARAGHVARFVPLALGAITAVLLVAVQLLPTLELTGLSSRQGGLALNEVLSFSLNPLLLTRALLPSVGQSLFSEYAAVLPLTVLALALVGAWQWRRRDGVLPALVWVVVGLLLALGVFNPANWLLAELPGFNLFRVPARWLILYALGAALLAGVGWDALVAAWQRPWDTHGGVSGDEAVPTQVTRPLLIAILLIAALIVWGFIAPLLVGVVPVGPEAPVESPNAPTLALWAIELAFLSLLFWLTRSARHRSRTSLILQPSAFILLLIVLFLATRAHPYNHLTTPEAYADLRPPIARLQAETAVRTSVRHGRVLGLSDIFFDPGDQAEIDSIYADTLPPDALYDYTIAIKHKEVLSPNLPQSFGLASVDGFDGGILPLLSYSELVSVLLPDGQTTTDGRLRENLNAVPDARWLDLFNAQFVITDKVGDVWREGVFFDQQHPAVVGREDAATIGYLPAYEATELWLIAGDAPTAATVTTASDTTTLTPEPLGDGLYRAVFPQPAVAEAIAVNGCEPACEIRAMTLVDGRDETFQPLAMGNYRLMHSGDVKIYENLDVLPRAFLVGDVVWQPDATAVLEALSAEGVDPRRTAVLTQPDPDALPPEAVRRDVAGTAEIVRHAPGEVVVRVEVDGTAVLVLTDANYPGWQATIDGQPTELHTADNLFRAVFVPAGTHEVVFRFESQSYRAGLIVSVVALVLFAGLAVAAFWWRRTA